MLIKTPAVYPSNVINAITSVLHSHPEGRLLVTVHGIGPATDVAAFAGELQQLVAGRADFAGKVEFAPVGTADAVLEANAGAIVIDCVAMPKGLSQLQQNVLRRLTTDAYTREELADHLGVSDAAVRFAIKRMNAMGLIDNTVAATICDPKEIGSGSLKS